MARQQGFAEAFLAPNAGRNRRLERIVAVLDWARFEAILKALAPSGGPGRPAYPPLMMFKALLLAQWHQLSDPALEDALADRISFRAFCGFALDAAACGARLSRQGRHHDRRHADRGAGGPAAR